MKKLSFKEKKRIKRELKQIEGVKTCKVYKDYIMIYVYDIDEAYYDKNSSLEKFFIREFQDGICDSYFLFGKKKFESICVDYNYNVIVFDLKE